MKKFPHKIAKWCWYVLAVAIIFAAITIAATRLLTPYFNRHLPDFDGYASQMFKTPVNIERVHLSWSLYEPELVFDQVHIIDKVTQKPVVSIRQIKLNFAIFRSLFAWQPMLDSLKISGVHFTIHEQASGEFNIDGYGMSLSDNLTGASLKTTDMLAWIFAQPKLLLYDIEILFLTEKGLKQPITLDNLVLTNARDAHSIHGQAIFQQEAPTSVVLDLNWHGKIDDLPHVTATLYLYLQGISLPERFSKFNWHGWQMKEGIGSAKIWVEWKENTLQSIQSQFQLYDIVLYSQAKNQSRSIVRISGDAKWGREGMNQVILGKNILIDLPQHLWPNVNFAVTLAPTPSQQDQFTMKTIEINYLDLEDVAEWLLVTDLLSDDNKVLLKNLNIQGEAKNFEMNLPLDTEPNLSNTVMTTELADVSFDSWNQYPGIDNLTGKFHWDGKQGAFQLNSQEIQFTYSKLFQSPLQFDKVTGQISLSKSQDNNYTLQADQLQLSNKDISAKTNFVFDVGSSASPSINLTSDYSVANAGQITKYLPMNLFDANLKKWLGQAFISGRITSGKIIFQGNLKDYPYDQNNGKFSIVNKVKNIEFNFAPGWPTLHKLTGTLSFEGSNMTADADSGFVYDVPLKQVHATMNNVGVAAPTILNVQGFIDSDLSKGLYYLHHSPLEKKIGSDLGDMSLTGPMKLKLDITVPLAKPEDAQAKGDVEFSNGILRLPTWNLTLDKMVGAFQFTENSIEAKTIQGRLLDETIALTLTTQPLKGDQKFIRADLNSKININALEKWLGMSLPKVLTGSTAYQVELDLTHHDNASPTHIILQSDLKGIAINIPSPYGKAADTVSNFKFDLFINDGQPLKGKLAYGNLATAAIILGSNNKKLQFIGGDIHLGSGDVDWPTAPGLSVTGQMDEFDWNTWKKYFDSLNTNTILQKKSAVPSGHWWQSVDVLIKKLKAMGQQLDQVRVQLVQLNNGLQIGLTTRDMQGQIILPDDTKEAIQAKFQRLYLSSAMKGNVGQWDPKKLPRLSFVGDDVRAGDITLGQVSFDTTPAFSGLTINNFRVASATTQITGKGDWQQSGNSYQTHLQGSLDSSNVSKLLKQWGFEQPNLVGKKGNAWFDFSWPDAPYNPLISSLSGDVTIKLGEGQIINLSSADNAKLGIGRMLNILSLDTLPRRLSLNFSDLTNKGYTFDSITGGVSFKNGNAYAKDFIINGPLARIDVSGRIGLQAKDYDLVVSVTPYVTSSLPMVATIASGFNPIAGVATWMVSKIVSPEVAKATTYHYKVTGPWASPVWESK